MPEVSPAARAVARRVLLHEAGGHTEPAALAEAAERADARLRGRLGGLIGQTGYTILADRAVRLARAEVPTLEGVAVDTGAEGGLRGVRAFALASDGDAGAAEAGLSAILAHVIGLLSTFIGEDLALRLIRETWPEIAHGQDESEGQA
jgi:hypothetical protein